MSDTPYEESQFEDTFDDILTSPPHASPIRAPESPATPVYSAPATPVYSAPPSPLMYDSPTYVFVVNGVVEFHTPYDSPSHPASPVLNKSPIKKSKCPRSSGMFEPEERPAKRAPASFVPCVSE
jgi:hypothetical protein